MKRYCGHGSDRTRLHSHVLFYLRGGGLEILGNIENKIRKIHLSYSHHHHHHHHTKIFLAASSSSKSKFSADRHQSGNA